ncbi:MAG: hypothetical protein JWO80_3505 [Bryobacterales bacterium]|nr:hypothetical protein [Bryobacterales bacterium]
MKRLGIFGAGPSGIETGSTRHAIVAEAAASKLSAINSRFHAMSFKLEEDAMDKSARARSGAGAVSAKSKIAVNLG